jgi:hypothetical protein
MRWRISCSRSRHAAVSMSRESVKDGELRLRLAAHNSAITDLYPGVCCKLIRFARDPVEKLAHNMAASKHKVSSERTRKAHEGKRCVACYCVNRPLNAANRLAGHRRRNGRSLAIVSVHPHRQPLRGQKIECGAEESEHASSFRCQRNICRRQSLDATETQQHSRGAWANRRWAENTPERSPTIANMETQKFKWTNERVKREQRVG